MRGTTTVLTAFLLLSIALAGCTTSAAGTASVYVKDAPTDEFDEIHVVFTRVDVHQSNRTDGGGAWVTLFENGEGRDVDLLNASGDRAVFLGEAELEPGRYQQVRIHVTEAYGVQNGTRVDFALSSTTLKVIQGFEVEDGSETRIVVDFNLDRSLTETGQGWRMTPVVGRTSTEIVDGDASGEEAHEEGEVAELS